MTSVATVVSELLAVPLPLLVADTCSLLDILRAPARLKQQDPRAATQIWLSLTQSPASMRLLLPHVVWEFEIGQGRGSAEADFRAFKNSMKDGSTRLRWLCDAICAAKPADAEPYLDDLVQSLTDIFEGILSSAIRLDELPECRDPAWRRVLMKQAPAHRKGEMKDAVIVEETYALIRQLRQSGFSPQIVFLTANQDDYLDSNHAVHPDLSGDFALLGMTLCLSWNDARLALGL